MLFYSNTRVTNVKKWYLRVGYCLNKLTILFLKEYRSFGTLEYKNSWML